MQPTSQRELSRPYATANFAGCPTCEQAVDISALLARTRAHLAAEIHNTLLDGANLETLLARLRIVICDDRDYAEAVERRTSIISRIIHPTGVSA